MNEDFTEKALLFLSIGLLLTVAIVALLEVA